MSGSAPTSFRWTICALLFAATTVNYIDRQILSLLKPMLEVEFGWTNAQFGWLNSMFQGAYAVSLLGFGWFIDRFGTKLGYAVSIVAWSIAAAAHALAGSFQGFAAARIALGLGEGGNFPAAVKTVAQWFPVGDRAFVTTLFNSGTNIGALVAPATIPFIASTLGWQAAFLIAGALGLVWAIAWWALYSAPRDSRFANAAEVALIEAGQVAETTEAPLPWGSLLGYRGTWSFILSKFITDPVWWFFLIWLPGYFKDVYHQDIKESAGKLVAIYAIVTVVSIAGGFVSKLLVQRGWSVTATRKSCMIVFALAVVPILLVPQFNDPWIAVALIGLAGGAHQGWSATIMTTVSDLFPRRAVASIIGMGGMAGALGGMLFPVGTGILLDHYKKLDAINTGYGILFGCCAFAYVVAFVFSHLLTPKFTPVKIDV